MFGQLVEDETYCYMSTSAHSLGLPSEAARALQVLRRLAEDLISRRPFKQVFRVGTRTVETVTHVPLPDSGAMAELVGAGTYLPPVVSPGADMRRPYSLPRVPSRFEVWIADDIRSLGATKTKPDPSRRGRRNQEDSVCGACPILAASLWRRAIAVEWSWAER